MATADGPLGWLKQPEYTGENRCLPCTVVNVVIAAAAGVAFAVGGTMLVSFAVGVAAGGVVFGLSALSIYFRGYLVPGTPELTKRYFPPWLLALFGKEPEHASAPEGDLDPEVALLEAGALEECADSEDLCLTEAFRTAWHEELVTLDFGDASRDRLLELLDIDAGEVHYEEFGGAFKARIDGEIAGQWESDAAFLADLGAAQVLSEQYPRWDDFSMEARGQLLNGLRLFLDVCPSCGGDPSFGAETVESCCASFEVAAVTCPDCGSRLFESPVNA